MVSKDYQTDMTAVLSPTFQSSQLHTPRHLSRITIDDNKYHGYRTKSVGTPSPADGPATQLDGSIWGRKHGYGGIGMNTNTEPGPISLSTEFPRSHKHFTSGIHPHPRTSQQIYRTSLDLDNIRSHDFKTTDRRDRIKELQSPFPAEHPFYSHTPRFSMFPGIQPSSYTPESSRPSSAGSPDRFIRRLTSGRPPSGNPNYNQAGASVYPDPKIRAPPPIVLAKTKGQGLRQEMSASRRVRSAAENWELDEVISRSDNLVWDVPRSARHEKVVTYPSPRLIFEGHKDWSRHESAVPVQDIKRLVSARTNHVLENLQRSYLQTTYQRQFTGVGPQGEAKLDDYVPGYRPYSAERGSALSTRTQLPSASYYRAVPWEGRHSASAAHFLRHSQTPREIERGETIDETTEGEQRCEEESSSDEEAADEKTSSRRVSFRNQSANQSDSLQLTSPTQFEYPEVIQHIYDPEEPLLDTERSGTIDVSGPNSPMSLKSSLKRVHISERPSSAPSDAPPIVRTPRTITSSKRLMDAYTFNRSELRKNFHYIHPEVSPDLRELARYPSAKRHTIHGIHSYYFH
ncbi:hypothetical protein LOD99_12922 [Oopsacas minuta]|uniref:Uncharacterized protein n=1 Tax=Oopsacas minuta TaxID=111878 RepID=A0AAV7J9S8_9METZ|nr:hypothetical protein LOD99_12922 [Oopsacas minuta]